jgi:hypothetical protein
MLRQVINIIATIKVPATKIKEWFISLLIFSRIGMPRFP